MYEIKMCLYNFLKLENFNFVNFWRRFFLLWTKMDTNDLMNNKFNAREKKRLFALFFMVKIKKITRNAKKNLLTPFFFLKKTNSF